MEVVFNTSFLVQIHGVLNTLPYHSPISMFLYFGVIGTFTLLFLLIAKYTPIVPLKWILILALVARLFVIFLFSHSLSSDIYSFLTTGHVLLTKTNTYPAMYFPFIFYLGALSILLGKYIAPLLFLKILFSLFDVGVTYYIYKLSNNPIAGLLYAINPVMLIIVAIHGQLDPMPLFFLLMSMDTMRNGKELFTAILLGIAIAIKPWPLIFLPVYLKQATNRLYFAAGFIIPMITVIIHSLLTHVPILDIVTPIKNYRGIYGIWGIGNIMYTLFPTFWEQQIQLFRRIFLILFGIWSFLNHNKQFIQEFCLTILVFFVFSPLFGVQWVSWIIPFIIMFDSHSSIRIVLITLYTSLALLSDITPSPIWYGPTRDAVINGISLVVWLSICSFFLSYRRRLLNSSVKKFVRYKH